MEFRSKAGVKHIARAIFHIHTKEILDRSHPVNVCGEIVHMYPTCMFLMFLSINAVSRLQISMSIEIEKDSRCKFELFG